MKKLIFVLLPLAFAVPAAADDAYLNTLGQEVCNDPISRGYQGMGAPADLSQWMGAIIADLDEIRPGQVINRDSMSGGSILNSLDAAELDALPDSDFTKVVSLLSVASNVDPFGPVGDLIFAKFPDGGASEIGFGTARQEQAPRWRKVGLSGLPSSGNVHQGIQMVCPEWLE